MIKKFNFEISNLNIELIPPKTEYAAELFHAITVDRDKIGKWLPWAYEINSSQDEANFIKQLQAKHEIIAWVILVNKKASGMIDLHHIVPHKKGEIGYWLSGSYQKRGIVTQSVLALCEYAFNELDLRYVDLKIDIQNDNSIAVAKRANFKLMGRLDNFYIFRKIRPAKTTPSNL